MDWIHHDISPVFGAGGASLSREGAVEEGRFSKPNVSGVIMDCALKNPIFSMNQIKITGGTDYRGKCVLWVDAPNVPMASYDAQKLGVKPSISSGNVEPYYWATSQNCSGTIVLDGVGEMLSGGTSVYSIKNETRHSIIAGYNEEMDTIDLMLVTPAKVSELPSCYTSMSILAQLNTYVQSGVPSQYLNTYFTYVNGETSILHNSSNSPSEAFRNIYGAYQYCTSPCIALTQIIDGRIATIAGNSLLPEDNSAPGETLGVVSPLSKYELYIPLVIEGGVPPVIKEIPSKGGSSQTTIKSHIIKLITGRYFI